MKKETLHKRTILANKIMFYIYRHIDTDINLDLLGEDLQVSKFHMHRIFKEAFGRNIYESIKSIRLQKASNLLITNKYSTISEIGRQCGYSSHSSFIRAFKERFEMTPKEWKNGGYKAYSHNIIAHSEHPTLSSKADFSNIEPEIIQMPAITAYYIRNQGYNRSMKRTWQKLYTWTLSKQITDYQQIALYHDNPSITPHESCQYIACIQTDQEGLENVQLPSFTIFGGTYAKFDLKGKHGDLLKLITWVYQEWLPESGFETTTRPSYAIHRKNHFLDEDGKFDVSYYVSVSY
jgi:AraC family transcriptional regulator